MYNHLIKKITDIFAYDVEWIQNSFYADYHQTAIFSLDSDNPQIHLPYQSLFLLHKNNSFVIKRTKDKFKQHNIPFNEDNYNLFILLHELGHYHHYINSNITKKDYQQFLSDEIKDIIEEHQNGDITDDEFNIKYCELPTEIYADSFAIKHFNQVKKELAA